MPTKKTCIDCGGVCYPKNVEVFRCRKCYLNYSKSLKTYNNTYEYRAEWHRRKKYNLNFGEFDGLWIIFNGRCGICNKELKMPTRTRGQGLDTVSIDHDHITGNIRGLLCSSCNRGIGFLNDDPEIILKAYIWVGGECEKVSNNKKN